MDTNPIPSSNHGKVMTLYRPRTLIHVSIVTMILTFSALQASALAGDVTLSWDPVTVSNLAGYKIYYGIASIQYGTPVQAGTTTSHTFTGLAAGTYYFAVTAYDTSGNESGFSNEVSAVVTVSRSLDTTPPVLSAISTGAVTYNSAAIIWATNEQSDSQVDYGTSTAYGSTTALDATMVTAHSQALGGLTGNTTYHYRVRSKDAAGNLAVSGDFTFTSPAASDTIPPVLSAVSTSSVSYNAATVTWITNENSDSQVEYGTSAQYGSKTSLDSTMVTAHSQALSGLTAHATYHFRSISKDSAGNLAYSPDFTFTTSTAPINVGLVLAYTFDEGAGTTVEDASGNSNSGTLFNCLWTSGGKYGKALLFDRKERYLLASTTGLPAMNSPQTVAYWYSATSKSSVTRPVVSLVNDLEKVSTQVGYQSSKLGVWQNPGSWLAAGNQPSSKVWHYFAYTYDGITHSFYIDGKQVSSSTVAPGGAAITSLLIGKMIFPSAYLYGVLDELRIYNRALSQTEIQTLMTTAIANSLP